MFTKEETTNLITLVKAGSRSLDLNSGQLMMVAQILGKLETQVSKLSTQNEKHMEEEVVAQPEAVVEEVAAEVAESVEEVA